MISMGRRAILSAMTAVGLAAITVVHVYYVSDVQRGRREALKHSTAILADRLSGRVRDMIDAVEGLGAFLTATPSLPDRDAFDRYTRQVVRMHPTVRVLQLVDANGLIVHELPVEGNESVLGLDLKPRADWSFLEKARRLRRTVVNPNPGQLVQGSLGVIIRTPLYRDDVFLGWAQGVFDVENLMHGAESQLPRRQHMQLVDSAGEVLLGSKRMPDSAISVPIVSNGSTWQLRVAWSAPDTRVRLVPLVSIWGGGVSLLAAVFWVLRVGWRKEEALRLVVRERTADLIRTNEQLRAEAAERKQAEEAQRAHETKYRHLVEQLPVITYTAAMDEIGGTIFVSPQIEAVLGEPPQVWMDNPSLWSSRVHPDDRGRVLTAWNDACRTDEPFRVEYRMTARDGLECWFFDEARIVRDAQGRPLVMQGVMLDISQRKRAEEALRDSANRLQHLSRRLLEVQEEERRHLARELHDEFGQLLAIITLYLHAAKGVAGEAARPRLEECMALLQDAGAQVRSLAFELRPAMLETAGLDATLRWLAEQHQQRTGIATQVVGHLNDMSDNLAIACFRVAQEALTNVVRHARAQHVWIELSQSESVLEMVVRDDGVGFDVARTLEQVTQRGRLGLLGMRERVQILGGSLGVDSEPGRGTRIRVSFPLAEAATEPAETVE